MLAVRQKALSETWASKFYHYSPLVNELELSYYFLGFRVAGRISDWDLTVRGAVSDRKESIDGSIG